MKRFGRLAALFTAISVVFTGCNAPRESVSEPAAELTRTVEAVSVEETAERETAAAETEERAETEVKAETTEAAPAEEADGEPEFMTYTEPDEGHVFVDFEYIEDAEGITDPEAAGVWLDRALEVLKETEEYKAFEEYVRSEDFDGSQFSEYVRNGAPTPKFKRAFIDDFDNNGDNEAFITFELPVPYYYDEQIHGKVRHITVYVGVNNAQICEIWSGNACTSGIYQYDIIDYGLCKQIIMHTVGLGVETTSAIFGVEEDKPKELFNLRVGYEKADCFLSAIGWQSMGCFMYYDTAAREYRAILGKELDVRDVLAMDTTGALDKFREESSEYIGPVGAALIGGKYYVLEQGSMDIGTPFTYENGVFVEQSDCPVRNCHTIMNSIEDIDYDAAVASMLTPEQARERYKNGRIIYNEPDEGNVFVDFEYIEDAEGITDPEAAGDRLDRALEVLKETEEYKAFEEYARSEDFDGSQFSEYVRNGSPVPKFKRAFIDDFDNNGDNEAFITFELPVLYNGQRYEKVRHFTVYVGANNAQICEIWSGSAWTGEIVQYNIIDYGLCKQLIICTTGLGVETGSVICGVKDGVPDVLYSFGGGYVKADCFLSGFGPQGSGDFMYYDTAAKEYRAIMGSDMSFEEWFAMDTSGSIDEEKRKSIIENSYPDARVIVLGGKYYCVFYGWMDTGEPYTYENGVFTYVGGDSPIRISKGSGTAVHPNCVRDIDYDAAVASMLTPEQAALL